MAIAQLTPKALEEIKDWVPFLEKKLQ